MQTSQGGATWDSQGKLSFQVRMYMWTDEAQLHGVWKLDMPRGRDGASPGAVMGEQEPHGPGLSDDGGVEGQVCMAARTHFLMHRGG